MGLGAIIMRGGGERERERLGCGDKGKGSLWGRVLLPSPQFSYLTVIVFIGI